MRRWRAGSRGLTIIEIMAVIAVSSLLLGGAWQLVNQSMHAYKQGLHDIRLAQGARATMRIMIHDLQRVSAGAAQRRMSGTNDQRVPPGDRPQYAGIEPAGALFSRTNLSPWPLTVTTRRGHHWRGHSGAYHSAA
jgi:prepilin-type N-terminal cleavage/methylation domain-containing protein